MGLSFPKLGGAETVVHHLGFIFCALATSHARILGFPTSWLLLGELSTIPLNVRWALIKSGHGDGAALWWTNWAFAGMFFVARVALYGFGLVDFHRTWDRVPASVCPQGLTLAILTLISAMQLLNLYWFYGIVLMGLRGGGKKAQSETKAE